MIELLPSGKSEGYEVCADDVALAVISPVAARNRAQAGVGCQGGFAPLIFLPGVMSRKKQIIPMLTALWG